MKPYLRYIKTGLLISLIIISNYGFSQNKKNYKKFREEFSKEFNDSEENNNTRRDTKNIFQKIDLPEWFFNPTQSNDSIIYAIGISDPEMNKDKAFSLAEMRAKAITAFSYNSNIKGLSDNYSNEKKLKHSDTYSTLFGDFYNIKSKLNFDTSAFKIEKTYFTDYNEAIVLSSYTFKNNHSLKNDTVNFFAEIFNIKKKAKRNHQIKALIKINSEIKSPIKDTTKYFSYKIKSLGESNKIYSAFAGEEHIIKNNNYRYKNSENPENKEIDKYITHSLSNGLWNAYISVLMQNILFSLENYKVKIKNLNDNYNKKNQNITRQILEKNISTKIQKIIIKNNKLIIKVDVKT